MPSLSPRVETTRTRLGTFSLTDGGPKVVEIARQLPHLQRRHGLAVTLEWLSATLQNGNDDERKAVAALWPALLGSAPDWLRNLDSSGQISTYAQTVRDSGAVDYMTGAIAWLQIFDTLADIAELVQS